MKNYNYNLTAMEDDYEKSFVDYLKLLEDISDMEANSQWLPGITAKHLTVTAFDGMEALMFANRANDPAIPSYEKVYVPYEILMDTTQENGTHLLLNIPQEGRLAIRNTCSPSLLETCKINGSALGRMAPTKLSEVLNNCFQVARGSSLALMRRGKISALLSDNPGGYKIMPISELLEITENTLVNKFGNLEFKHGYNSHAYTSALWELPDAQAELLDKYQKAIAGSVGNFRGINFMPAVRFCSSDTGGSAATLMPLFKLRSGTYFRINDGLKVDHKRSSTQNVKDGIDLYEEVIDGIFAKFVDTATTIGAMASCTIYNPSNALIGICKKANIAKKYAMEALEELERYTLGKPCSMHDIYLSIAECIGYANRDGVKGSVINNLEENIARILHFKWDEFDIPGVVSWAA